MYIYIKLFVASCICKSFIIKFEVSFNFLWSKCNTYKIINKLFDKII